MGYGHHAQGGMPMMGSAGVYGGAPVVSFPAPPAAPVAQATKAQDIAITSAPAAPVQIGSSTELLEAMMGRSADAPMCMTCGVKMRAAGACYVCEGCGSTSGCS